MKKSENIGYLYVNGLNDGQTKPQDRLAMWRWRQKGLDLKHAHVNWLDGHDLDSKIDNVKERVEEMLGQFGGVALIGSSAGGSLALNTFHKLRNKNVCIITAHARLKAGDYPQNERVSLYRRAGMDTDKPSQAFVDSVTRAETETIPNLSEQEKQRIRTLSSLADMVVPPRLMTIDGVSNHRSLAFGHAGGWLAHFIADRDLITGFAETSLL